jgi:hypothetical protein
MTDASIVQSPRAAIEFMLAASERFAKAKARRIYLEEFRKSKKAILMSRCEEKAAVAREQWAYAHPEYTDLLLGIQAAVEEEEALRWQLEACKARIEVWRTDQANARAEHAATR